VVQPQSGVAIPGEGLTYRPGGGSAGAILSQGGTNFLIAVPNGNNIPLGTMNGGSANSATLTVNGASADVNGITASGGTTGKTANLSIGGGISDANTSLSITVKGNGGVMIGSTSTPSSTFHVVGNGIFTTTLAVGTTTTSTATFNLAGTANITQTTTLPSVTANSFLATDANNNIIATSSPVIPTIATTSKTIYDINSATTDYPSFLINAPAAFTIRNVDCYNDNAAGNTFTFNIVASTTVTTGLTYASSSLLFTNNVTCSATSTVMSTTTFANASVSAGQSVWLWITSASSTGAHIQIDY